MVIKFEEKYLEELFDTGKCSDKKHRYQPSVIEKYRYCIDVLAGAKSVESLYIINALHFEALRGAKAGIFSIRVNLQYRIEFTVHDSGTGPVLSICRILELSNHYK